MFRADLPSGYLYLEDLGFTYKFYDGEPMKKLHGTSTPSDELPKHLDAHAFKVLFKDCNPTVEYEKFDASQSIQNFYVGNDRSKWASNVHSYRKVKYNELYDGIDMAIYDQDRMLKYDFIVAPGADPSQIGLTYEGVDDLYLDKGNLHIKTSVAEMIEQSPVAFQMVNGVRTIVKCKFVLDGNTLSFKFPRGYDESLPLIIDPILIFSSYTGSAANNFGFTATYDDDGNLYGGGIVFTSVGTYPTTTGAFQVSLVGGIIDMGITKFNSDGTALIYSTIIGGTANESPHSMVVNSNDELCIMGTTGSADFPTSVGCYDNTFDGGTGIASMVGYGYDHSNGIDIVVCKLSADGTALLGSTFVGGTENDGVSLRDSIDFNYGDTFRGEIIVDPFDNILVASVTGSSDFPTANAPQNIFGGGDRDGIAFKLNSTLGALMWSTFVGGSSDEAAYSIQLDSNNDIYICGGTKSSDFPTTPATISPTYNGKVDGFIVHYNSAGGAIVASTFIGTSGHDQTYFIQLDLDDDVYVVGQSAGGNYPVSSIFGSIYLNNGSAQFLHKLNNTLDATEWSTQIGSGNGTIDFSICAFLVSKCDHIYISGWGGATNLVNRGFLVATGSSTTGLPITNGATNAAFQSTTDGSDFYLMVLGEEAQSLLYATYFGGTLSNEHVDGGTSRFDKEGKVYQAVCAGCGGNDDFPSTPGAWSPLNNSSCNLGVFKFDLAQLTSDVDAQLPYICVPGTVTFQNNSNGGTDYYWDFGDGNFSTDFEPTHTYTDTGSYTIMLVVSDSLSCVLTDTSYITLDAFGMNNAEILPVDTICPEDSLQLFASGGTDYVWSPTTGLSDPNIANPMASPGVTTTYTVYASDSCGVDSTDVTVHVWEEDFYIMPDTFICIGNSVDLIANGAIAYTWSPAATLSDPNSATPTATPTVTTTYYVTVTTPNNCTLTDSVTVTVDTQLPTPQLTPDTTICYGTALQMNASGATSYVWSPATGLTDPNIANPIASPATTTTYTVDFMNGCGVLQRDVTVTISIVDPVAAPDQFICLGDTAQLWATGGDSYSWSPASTLSQFDVSNPQAWPTDPTTYSVVITNSFGCADTAYTTVFIYPKPFVDAGDDQVIQWGSSTVLTPSGTGFFEWLPGDSMSCTNCVNPVVEPTTSTQYVVMLTDINGCTNMDTVTIFVEGSLYVPNTFTPNGDGINDYFYAEGEEIEEFEMWIFNRWGELIFTSESLNNGWDGRVNGVISQIDTYVWKIKFKEYSGKDGEIYGHVNLVR